jgi:hypothetical protein
VEAPDLSLSEHVQVSAAQKPERLEEREKIQRHVDRLGVGVARHTKDDHCNEERNPPWCRMTSIHSKSRPTFDSDSLVSAHQFGKIRPIISTWLGSSPERKKLRLGYAGGSTIPYLQYKSRMNHTFDFALYLFYPAIPSCVNTGILNTPAHQTSRYVIVAEWWIVWCSG